MTTVKLTREKSEEFISMMNKLKVNDQDFPQKFIDLFSMPDDAQEKLIKTTDILDLMVYLSDKLYDDFTKLNEA